MIGLVKEMFIVLSRDNGLNFKCNFKRGSVIFNKFFREENIKMIEGNEIVESGFILAMDDDIVNVGDNDCIVGDIIKARFCDDFIPLFLVEDLGEKKFRYVKINVNDEHKAINLFKDEFLLHETCEQILELYNELGADFIPSKVIYCFDKKLNMLALKYESGIVELMSTYKDFEKCLEFYGDKNDNKGC